MSNVREQLPAFHYFNVGNDYSGSKGKRRYKILTNQMEKTISIFVYEGDLCFELAKEQDGILFEEIFDLTPDGFEKMKSWLGEKMDEGIS